MTTERQLANSKFALYGTGTTFITGLLNIVDAIPDEAHSLSISKTEFPIETGGAQTDNAVKNPDRLVLEGWVSNLLINNDALVDLPAPGRPIEAWGRIRALAEDREPISVVTTLQTYDNMLITSVTARKNKDTGDALIFKITFEEALIAETQLTRLPPSRVDQDGPAANNTSQVNGGRKQANQPTAEQNTLISDTIRIQK